MKKTGGRQKGTKNRATIELEQRLARIGQDNPGLEPLEYLLLVLRDPAMRLEAAKIAAPYRHPRLAQVDHRGNVGLNVTLSLQDVAVL